MNRRRHHGLLSLTAVASCLAVYCSARAQEIWFSPQAAPIGSRLNRAVDFMELFRPEAPWQDAASHIKVFKLYASYLSRAPQEEKRKEKK